MSNSAIILPLKESFSNKDFGAVSIWVNYYIKNSSNFHDLVFCRKLPKNIKYLNKNICPINVDSKIFTNRKYIQNISNEIKKREISSVEIHNRPEYAYYLIKNNPDIKINLIFHNDPNFLRYSDNVEYKNFLLNNCNKILFVSNWIKKRFFLNLNLSHKNNTEIVYNFINPIKKFPKKKKLIVFSGKLNKSKGYDIFGKSVIKILNKHTKWKAEIYGNEERETFSFNHPRLKINSWISHDKLLKVYENASISVVNPTWDEPFGRTALESASRGCAVITSKSGGLSETFKNNLVLKVNNSKNLIKKLNELIRNKKKLKKIQLLNYKNVIHKPEKNIKILDGLRSSKKFIKFPKLKNFRILHISNFGIKNDHRIFNISIAKKISNGLIRNGHDVINFDYRNFSQRLFDKNTLDNKIISIIKNYQPNLILLGHNNILDRKTLLEIKDKYLSKIALWYEDHLMKGDPNFINNLKLVEKNNDLIDQYFITTAPDVIKTKIEKKKLNFLPIPVDPMIENGEFFNHSKSKDLFFALSHGVNFGKLKKNTFDSRLLFIEDLLMSSNDKINYHIFGLYGHQPKWNFEFNNELKICKTALNLSRGGPTKYCSSNRIASLMGNGVLPFIDSKIRYQDFFDNDEIETYSSSSNLISKLTKITSSDSKLIKRSRNAKKRYFDIFECRIIADYITYKVFETNRKYNFIWDKR